MKRVDFELRNIKSPDIQEIPLASVYDENHNLTTTYTNFVDAYNYADGDTADLTQKLNDAIANRQTLTTSLSDAQTKYDEANARYCADKCGKKNNPPCHSQCWSKDRDKRIWSDKVSQIKKDIVTNEGNITTFSNLLAVSKQQDLEGTNAKTQQQVDLTLAQSGQTRESAQISAQKQGTNKMLLIVGGLGIVALATILLLKRN